jgi:ribosomal protein S18 acetylase RimI-like enzyme
MLYTHPDFVGHGIGKALFDYMEMEMKIKNDNHCGIILNSTITAKNFYIKMGLTVLKEAKYRFDNGIEVDIFKMEKIIQ